MKFAELLKINDEKKISILSALSLGRVRQRASVNGVADMARIYPGMGFMDGLTVMCDGNPGAMQVVAALVKRSWLQDVIRLDDLGIYGADIWLLYKDECHEDLRRMHLVLLERSAALVSRS